MNPYEVLGVERDSDAQWIERKYRHLSKANHPDRNPGDAEAAERYRQIQDAYTVLRDPVLRAQYDATGEAGKPKDPYEELRTLLVPEILAAYRARGPWGTHEPSVTHVNLVDKIVSGLIEKQRQVEAALEAMAADERAFNEILKRLTVADDINIFEEPIKAQLAGIARHRSQAKAELDVLRRGVNYMRKCHYKVGVDAEFRSMLLGEWRPARSGNALPINRPNKPTREIRTDEDVAAAGD